MRHSSAKRIVFSYSSLPQDTRENSNKETKFTPKEASKRRLKNLLAKRKKKNQSRNKWKRNKGGNSKNQ